MGAEYAHAIHAAAAAGCMPTLQPLIVASAGDAASLRDAAGRQPLHAAASHARVAAIEALLAVGAGVDTRVADKLQRTPLMLVAACRDDPAPDGATCVSVLLEQRADVTAVDQQGNAALHLACAPGGDPAIVQALVDGGAPLFALNARGQAPLDLCTAGSVLRGILDAAIAKRLKQGSREANAAQQARAALVRRLRELQHEEPALLQSLCDEDPATRALLSRFGLRAPSDAARVRSRHDAANASRGSADAVDLDADGIAAAAADAAYAEAEAAEAARATARADDDDSPTARATQHLRGLLDSLYPPDFEPSGAEIAYNARLVALRMQRHRAAAE